MSLAQSPVISAPSLREIAVEAWQLAQAERAKEEQERRDALLLNYRTGLRGALESTLRVHVPLGRVTCPLTPDRLDLHDVPDGGAVAEVTVDGLRLMLQRRGSALRLALYWQCPTCGMEPIADTTIQSLSDLGALLEYLPTLCQHDGTPGCQVCDEPHGVSVPCGFRRSQP